MQFFQLNSKFRTVRPGIPSFLVPYGLDSFLPKFHASLSHRSSSSSTLCLWPFSFSSQLPATPETAPPSSSGLATQTYRGSLGPWFLVRLKLSVWSTFLEVAHRQLQLANPAKSHHQPSVPITPEARVKDPAPFQTLCDSPR